MSITNYRTINVDAYDPDSSQNFDLATLAPGVAPTSAADVQATAAQIRQLLRGGDSEGALRGALETAPYGADKAGKDAHAAAVVEVLQSIRQADMTPLLGRIAGADGGSELLDVLMKYLYKGMAAGAGAPGAAAAARAQTPQSTGFSQIGGRNVSGGESGGQQMSVLLSWHEKAVEVAGVGSIARVMSDRRTV